MTQRSSGNKWLVGVVAVICALSLCDLTVVGKATSVTKINARFQAFPVWNQKAIETRHDMLIGLVKECLEDFGDLITTVLSEEIDANWWNVCVSEKIRTQEQQNKCWRKTKFVGLSNEGKSD